MIDRSSAALLTLVALLTACATPMADVRTLYLRPDGVDEPSPAAFEQTIAAVERAGYVLGESDPAHGRFEVPAAYRGRFGSIPYVFRIQLFREGWIRIQPVGPYITEQGDTLHLPDELRREYVRLALAVRESLVDSEGGAEP